MELNDIIEAKEQLQSHIDETSEEELSSVDLAEHLKTLKKHDEDEYVKYLEKLDPESLANAALEMPDHMIEDIIENVPTDKLVEAVEELESDDQTELLHYIGDIDQDKAKEVFEELDKKDQEDILKISKYSDNEAGAYMQTEFFSANLSEKLQSAIDRLRIMKESEEIENVFQLFVLDDLNRLTSAVYLSDLITHDFSLTLKEIVDSLGEKSYKPRYARDSDDIDEVVIKFEEFDLSVLPIVDDRGVLIGRITADDIHEFIQERATEQIYNLAGVDDEAEEEDTLFKAGKARAIWLFVNLCTAVVSSSIIGLFDKTIESIVALAILMPIVASMGGNTGTQALTVTVRKLALGEIEFRDKKDVIFRELTIAGVNGLIFAALMGIVAYFWFDIPYLGLVMALSMLINLASAGFFGTVIPLTLKKLDIDPAVGSSVVLTTFTDIIGFFSFLGLATWILL